MVALFGEDSEQGQNDPLLVGITSTTLGKWQAIGNLRPERVLSTAPLIPGYPLLQTPPSRILSGWRSLTARKNSGGSAGWPENTIGTSEPGLCAKTRSRDVPNFVFFS